MAGDKILVLGGTGPAGICLVRELLHRKLKLVLFARSPEKLPRDLSEDLSDNSLLEVIKGEMTDTKALSRAVSKCRIILSFLGPQIMKTIPQTLFADFYRALFPIMREQGVRRIFAVSTVSIYLPEDESSWIRSAAVAAVRLIAPTAYRNVLAVGEAFKDKEATRDIDWTVFRVGDIPGGSDVESWKRDREDGNTYAGPVGKPGWSIRLKRAALARWVANVAESGAPDLIGKLPAISRLSEA